MNDTKFEATCVAEGTTSPAKSRHKEIAEALSEARRDSLSESERNALDLQREASDREFDEALRNAGLASGEDGILDRTDSAPKKPTPTPPLTQSNLLTSNLPLVLGGRPPASLKLPKPVYVKTDTRDGRTEDDWQNIEDKNILDLAYIYYANKNHRVTKTYDESRLKKLFLAEDFDICAAHQYVRDKKAARLLTKILDSPEDLQLKLCILTNDIVRAHRKETLGKYQDIEALVNGNMSVSRIKDGTVDHYRSLYLALRFANGGPKEAAILYKQIAGWDTTIGTVKRGKKNIEDWLNIRTGPKPSSHWKLPKVR